MLRHASASGRSQWNLGARAERGRHVVGRKGDAYIERSMGITEWVCALVRPRLDAIYREYSGRKLKVARSGCLTVPVCKCTRASTIHTRTLCDRLHSAMGEVARHTCTYTCVPGVCVCTSALACLQNDSGSLPLERRFNIVHAYKVRWRKSATHAHTHTHIWVSILKYRAYRRRDTAHSRTQTHTRERRDVIVAAESAPPLGSG